MLLSLRGPKIFSCKYCAKFNPETTRPDATYAPTFGTYKTGKISLQDHGNNVKFRNIKIREF